MTLRQRELIDGPSIGCDHEIGFAFCALAWNEPAYRGFSFSANDGSHRQIEFLGRARVYADSRPGDVALRRQHALPGADCAGRHANHSGLRHGAAHAGEPMGRAERRKNPGDAHPGDALSLGPHPGNSFFFAVYVENNEFQFYSFRSKFLGRDSLKQVFEAQMALPYFPVDMSAMSAKRKFKELDGGDSFKVGENKITAHWLNHPQGCLGFRIETPAGIVAYATDNEPGDAKLDESLRKLAAGADILINDAQFTPEQLVTTRKGWGHSSWLEGVKVARHAGAKTLVLFHHDPDSTDRMVDLILRQAREEFDSVFAASEGMVVTLGTPGDRVQAHMPGTRTALRREAQFHAKVCGVTEAGKDFEEETVVRDISLQGALISLKHLPRLQSELQVTMEAPGGDGVQTMKLRGYVVRIDSGEEKGCSSVGVVFTD